MNYSYVWEKLIQYREKEIGEGGKRGKGDGGRKGKKKSMGACVKINFQCPE